MGDTASLLLAVLLGSIGLGYFVYGKRQGNAVSLAAGVGLMVIPYFIGNHYVLSAAGIGLMFLPMFIAWP